MEEQAASTPTSSSEAASSATQNDGNDGGGESSVPAVPADPKEQVARIARIRSLFPLPLPSEVMTKIEHLACMNCIREHRRALHREMRDTEIFLTIVDPRTWNGRDYLGAHRIPPLISGVASDSDEWTDSDWNSDDEEEEEPGMIGWGGVFADAPHPNEQAAAAQGGGGNGNGNGAAELQALMRMLVESQEGRVGSAPHPNQQAASSR